MAVGDPDIPYVGRIDVELLELPRQGVVAGPVGSEVIARDATGRLEELISNSGAPKQVTLRMADQVAIGGKGERFPLIVSRRETPLVRRYTVTAFEHVELFDARIGCLSKRRRSGSETPRNDGDERTPFPHVSPTVQPKNAASR
jgi:hypothetical protein